MTNFGSALGQTADQALQRRLNQSGIGGLISNMNQPDNSNQTIGQSSMPDSASNTGQAKVPSAQDAVVNHFSSQSQQPSTEPVNIPDNPKGRAL